MKEGDAMESKRTQNQLILDYIEKFGSITQLEANRDLGVMRLSARIGNLRAAGHPIITDIVAVPNRYGKKSRVARYRLEGDTDGH